MNYRVARWRLSVALALFFGVGLPVAPPAAAMVILGGGAAIVVDGINHCTLTTIGRDRTGNVVGFTGAQCGGQALPSPSRERTPSWAPSRPSTVTCATR